MNLDYQHANPSTGGGSYLLRFEESTRQRTPCVLVDSGTGVDLDSLLGEDEYLAAILLTHAHLDHYASLSESVRDGAPVYAARPTADVLTDVLSEGEKNYEIGGSEDVVDSLEPLDGWTTLVPNVEVAPFPVGHAPGASGFVVRFDDGSGTNHVLVTGDFTTRDAAGYPGLSTDLPIDVDVLVVNVSTNDDFEEILSDSLFTIVERAQAGSSVLATASALTGVHYAYLLGHLGDALNNPVPVTLAGQAAKLYADLDYDVPNVTTVPVFEDPTELLDRGTVTIAGPEVPVEGGARRLFEAIEDDSSATLVQLTGGATEPVETASCTVYDFEVVNHPPMSVIDDVVTAFDPIHVVAGHGPQRTLREFRGRYDERFVWASDDDREQTLYADGRWSPPPWLSETAVQSIRAQDWQSSGLRGGDVGDDEVELPAVERADPDLEAEGVALDRFESRFGKRDDSDETEDESDTTETPAESATETPAESASETPAESASEAPAESASEAPAESASDSLAASERPALTDAGAFRAEVLERLDALESEVSGTHVTARVVDGGDDVTLLRLLDDADLEHGEELTVVLSENGAVADESVGDGETVDGTTPDSDGATPSDDGATPSDDGATPSDDSTTSGEDTGPGDGTVADGDGAVTDGDTTVADTDD